MGGEGPTAPVPVSIDVDTGVDDAMALVYFASKEAELVGMASTAGNVPVQQVCRNNLGLLELCQITDVPCRRAPIGRSAHRCGPRKTPTDPKAWVMPSCRRRMVSSPPMTPPKRGCAPRAPIPADGGNRHRAVTNLALALRIEPALPKLLRRLVIMGGAFDYRGNTTPVAEWNISVDPEAAAEVFAVWGAAWGLEPPKHIPIILGLNLTENVAMTPTILSRLATAAESSSVPMSVLDDRGTRSVASNPLIRVLEDAMRFYFEFHFDQGEGYLAHLHDPLAAAVALDPDLVQCGPPRSTSS